MKTLSQTLLLVILTGILATASFAQGAAKPAPKPGQMNMQAMMALQQIHNKVLKDLKLSPDQMKKVEAANLKLSQEMIKLQMSVMGDVKPGTQPTEAQMKAIQEKAKALQPKMAKLQVDHQATLKKIMGDKKFAEYEKNMKPAVEKWRADQAKKSSAPKPGGKG